MKIIHVELKNANAFVENHHRHHRPVVGHRFSIGAEKNSKLVGVAIIGRPVARMTDQSNIVEITRLCTDGTRNACSFLYGAAARAAKALGYNSIQTFILSSESGTTLKAAGWRKEHTTKGGEWTRISRSRNKADNATPKEKWVKYFTDIDAAMTARSE